MNKNKVTTMTIAALLCAIGIIIPMFAPKILLPPVSYTLGSHVPIFIAMFLSPPVAIVVSLVTGGGFFIAGFPPIIVARALTHVIFAGIGSILLKNHKGIMQKGVSSILFSLFISLIHGICEVIAVSVFFAGNQMDALYYNQGYLITVVGFVGIGTVIHSMIDFGIAVMVWRPMQKIITIPTNVRLKPLNYKLQAKR